MPVSKPRPLSPTKRLLLETPLREKYGDELDFVAWRQTPEGRNYILAYGLKSKGIVRNDGRVLPELPLSNDVAAVDLETTSLNPLEARIVGVSYALPEGGVGFARGEKAALLTLGELSVTHRALVFQNAKYDLKVLKMQHPEMYEFIVANVHDTMLMAYVLDPSHHRYGLQELMKREFGYDTVEHDDIRWKGIKRKRKDGRPFEEWPEAIARDYAQADAQETLLLAAHLSRKLAQDPPRLRLYTQLERRLLPELVELELHGLQLDVAALDQLIADLDAALGEAVPRLREAAKPYLRRMPTLAAQWAKVDRWNDEQRRLEAGEKVHPRLRVQPDEPEFNPASDQQVAALLYDGLQLPKPRFKTKSGQEKTDAEALNSLKLAVPEEDPRLQVLEDLGYVREMVRVRDTYARSWRNLMDVDGRLRHQENQTGTRTGRLSHSEPNLGNVARLVDKTRPPETRWAERLRRCVVARPGYLLGSCDYSQLELRGLAHFSRDSKLLRAYNEGVDLHQMTADALGIERDAAKTVNFLVVYQGGPSQLQRTLLMDLGMRVPLWRCKQFIETWYAEYTEATAWIRDAQDYARQSGFVKTAAQRLLPTAGGGSRIETFAVNAPIQGTGGDIIRMAVVEVGASRHWPKWRLLLTVHDDLVFEVREDCVDEWAAWVSAAMRGIGVQLKLRVPLEVEAKVGPSWAEMEKLKAVELQEAA